MQIGSTPLAGIAFSLILNLLASSTVSQRDMTRRVVASQFVDPVNTAHGIADRNNSRLLIH